MEPSSIRAFIWGYRQGREGLPPAPPLPMTEQELADLESANPPASAHEWMWHGLGWTYGREIAQFEMEKP